MSLIRLAVLAPATALMVVPLLFAQANIASTTCYPYGGSTCSLYTFSSKPFGHLGCDCSSLCYNPPNNIHSDQEVEWLCSIVTCNATAVGSGVSNGVRTSVRLFCSDGFDATAWEMQDCSGVYTGEGQFLLPCE